MKIIRDIIIFFIAFLIFTSSLIAEQKQLRVISMAPSITEIVFQLGLSDSLVGVTKFCNYPKKAQSITKVGGFLDPNLEEIIRLKPNLVLLLEAEKDVKLKLDSLNINNISVEHKTISGILSSITELGESLGKLEQADKIIFKINNQLSLIKKIESSKRPKVLITIDGHLTPNRFDKIYVASRKTFYNELVELAGGENAYKGANIKYPQLSAEGLLSLQPDIIIDLVPKMESRGIKREVVMKNWSELSTLTAYKKKKIYILSDDFFVTPGPRFVKIVKKFNEIFQL